MAKSQRSYNPDEVKYAQAIERLDEIIAQIEDDDVDVDELSLQVKEAVELIRICKSKIDRAELDVKQVVAKLSQQTVNDKEDT